MCGISGIFTLDPADPAHSIASIRHMMSLMVHRGPDDEGTWNDSLNCTFGFRRLSILDLSQAGHQPMVSGDGRSVLVFNGEVYNFQELRHDLRAEGIRFRSRTDTEVVLEALNHWGLEALQRFNGMFALGWYHLERRELLLARDHAGIKPLFYRQDVSRGVVHFASQLNCLVNLPGLEAPKIRPEVLGLHLRLHYTPPPYSIYEGIHQLGPGQFLLARLGASPLIQTWWSLLTEDEIASQSDSSIDELEGILDRTVRKQRIADVPLGVFLSGGVDSPLVTAVARKQTDSSLRAFTIGSPGWQQDESDDASRFAACLDVTHRLHSVTEAEALETLGQVAQAQTEPFADFSILPTLLVSQLARREVTVALSGDGGDELFFGYMRPFSLLRNGADFRYPHWLRKVLYGMGRLKLGPQRSSVIVSKTPGEYYFGVNSRWDPRFLKQLDPAMRRVPEDFRLFHFDGKRTLRRLAHFSRRAEYYGQMQRCLRKVDMASMHHSLEVRVPILDREVIEFSLKMDALAEVQCGITKRPLRELLARYVPASAISRQKRGFSVPLGSWLRGPMRAAVEDTLLSPRSWVEGWFGRAALRGMWQEHLTGASDHKWALWTLLSLEWWHRTHAQAATEFAGPGRR